MNKILKVVKTLFGTAVKKYPWFFVLETLKTINSVFMPFIGIIITPMIIDEICGAKDIHRLARLALVFIISECVLNILQEWISSSLNKYQERLSNYFTIQIGVHSMNLDFQLT